MESIGKRKWKRELEESIARKSMKMSTAGNQSEGTTSSSKPKRKAQAPATAEITPQNIAFNGLSGMDCRK